MPVIFLLLFGLLAYLGIIALLFMGVRRLSRNRAAAFLVTLLAVGLMAMDVYGPAMEVQRLCRKVGLAAYAPVNEPAKGYFWGGGAGCDAHCRFALIMVGFDFVEAELTKERAGDHNVRKGRNLTEGSGVYRFSKEPRGHPACRVFYDCLSRNCLDSSISERPFVYRHEAFLETHCIGARKISRPTAKFHVHEEMRQERTANLDVLQQIRTVDAQETTGKTRIFEHTIINWEYRFIYPMNQFLEIFIPNDCHRNRLDSYSKHGLQGLPAPTSVLRPRAAAASNAP